MSKNMKRKFCNLKMLGQPHVAKPINVMFYLTALFTQY